MNEEDIKFEIGIRNNRLVDLNGWKITTEPIFFKGCFESFFGGYCKYNKYDSNLVFRYINSEDKLIGATTFHSENLDAEFVLFNFNSIPLLKSYYYTLMKYYLLGDIDTVWQSIIDFSIEVNKTEYETDFEQKSIIYLDVWNQEFYDSLANFMTFISAQFLFNHEVAHCLNGHTRFRESSKFASYLSEHSISQSKVLKTMEMDADAYAAGSR
jgi:hypothetical protein